MPHQCLKCGLLFAEGSTTILRGCPDCHGSRFFYTDSALGADERKRLLQGSEVTLREAIEDLVKKAKDGLVETEEGGWVLAGPPPTKIVADPKTVPPDMPQKPIPHLPSRVTVIRDQDSKVLVKLPKSRKGRRDPVRWEYVAPQPTTPSPSKTIYVATNLPLTPVPVEASPTVAVPPLVDMISPAPAPSPPAPPAAPPTPAPSETASSPIEVRQTTLDVQAAPAPGPVVVPTPAPVPEPLKERPPPFPSLLLQAEEAAPETIRIHQPGRYEIDVKRLLEESPVVVQRDGTYLIHLPSLFEVGTKGRR